MTLRIRACVILLIGFCLSAGALADRPAAFRVCADPNNMPLSSQAEDGFENKIAKLWADQLGLPLEYTWFPQRRGFIRNTLKAFDESGDGYKCDVVMGVAAGMDRLLTTRPYYRSTYALVYAKGHGIDHVKSGEDFINLDAEIRDGLKIGAFTPTPGTMWLARHGMTEQIVAFVAMSGNPADYPGEIIEKELAGGNLDAAIVWGPMAGYFARRADNVDLVVIPLMSEPGIQFDFSIAAGVRYGDGARKSTIEDLIVKTSAQMQQIFAEFNVPLLDVAPDPELAATPDDR